MQPDLFTARKLRDWKALQERVRKAPKGTKRGWQRKLIRDTAELLRAGK